ncbi:phosphoribosylanthranilate isomerase [Clostridium felsineum]|uniref:N-(5'-phosphoribosyl)anthranilate isomerase n=1 Tax=Clostridium felsineum TaxID=36839 RepID=A0A1S8KXQ9_9CLOT|nr:phosphoribosylanthranilate isomerase [Clostridium felsineum]URZ03446.1 N-(5'-phosphoribosyl)anthranilate isomerase [Clostridium felsineum]URZ08238.1 N-(5'-phosphoribosyl)anthranilate isomerase [Clostridium felsineum]URZ13269.1 N-(5'-phosphoribosyl)anthranilate isomerase [Clostridium felsineum]
MVKVKICGIRREKDIEIVNKYQPDYIGFVFARSKRQVDAYIASVLGEKLMPNIKKIGVFVNEDIKRLKEIVLKAKLDIVQLHGDEDSKYIEKLRGINVWKAVNISSKEDRDKLKNYEVSGFIVDSIDGANRGGNGRVFDWKLLKEYESNIKKPIIVAGGLNIDNVNECIKTLNPFCVDVSSGVETDGFKDEEKIKKFILKVRNFK